MSYSNEKTGVLFRNEDKREGRKDPDYKGSAEIEGTQYWLSAWINEAKSDGRKFMSLKFQQKDQRKPAARNEQEAPPFDDADIPFSFAWLAPLGAVLMGVAHAAQNLL